MATPQEITRTSGLDHVRYGYGTLGVVLMELSPVAGGGELDSRLAGLMAVYNSALGQYQSHLVAGHTRETTWTQIARVAVRDAINAGLSEARAAEIADRKTMQPTEPVDAAFAADVWSMYRPLQSEGRFRAIAAADLAELTAIHQFGNRIPLTPDEAAVARDRFVLENWLVDMNVAARHPAVSSVDQPLRIGADMDATRREVEGWMKAHTERLAALKTDERTVRDLLIFLGAVYDVAPAEVLDAALGRDDA